MGFSVTRQGVRTGEGVRPGVSVLALNMGEQGTRTPLTTGFTRFF